MPKKQSIAARNEDILNSIVRSYIETGEPVASRFLSKRRRDGLSAASIRNIMADLSEEGYLEQPHTSAGRIPTEKAFKTFVRSLARGRVLAEELHRLRTELTQHHTVEARVEFSSHTLTEMTRSMGIAAAIPTSTQTLDQIELIRLADNRVLMIVATRDRMIRNRVIALDEPISQDELHSIRNYINANFSGWMLSELHPELKRRLDRENATYDSLLKKLTLLYAKGLLDVGLLPEVHVEGTGYLVGLDLHLTQEKLRNLFRSLEEKKRILQLLDRFLEADSGELSVQIGLGDADPSMRELSLIGIKVALDGGLTAKIAVLGPMRMNYEKAISAVLHMGEAFHSIPA